ncbi:hypothetical protein [Arcticibacter sp.]|uniref:hypothetical protein n=1 Tax=Arcticibacter sp. TaxID=1872630 RepID=UPI00388E7385
MEEFKGTKGEWFVSGFTEIVSMPSQTKISNSISGNSFEEAMANSILIASAPELLSLLRELVEDIQDEPVSTSINNTICRANTAINKALNIK